jgi:hypothetical protein
MLGRSIDCCWIQKRQILVMPSSDVFVSFSRLKTASSQGISLYQAKYDWELCPVLALEVCFITSEFPSEFIFNHLSPDEDVVAPHLLCLSLFLPSDLVNYL